MLMADLRPGAAAAQTLSEALRARAATFSERSGVPVELIDSSRAGDRSVSQQEAHELLRIVGEAMTNAVTHGHASRVKVALRDDDDGALMVSVIDDGEGLAGPVDLEALKAAGHFGLAGMHERARAIDGTLLIEQSDGGTAVSVRLPVSAAERSGEAGAPRRLGRRWSVRRRRGALEPHTATKEAS
jgi:signal transduction histidine kinase